MMPLPEVGEELVGVSGALLTAGGSHTGRLQPVLILQALTAYSFMALKEILVINVTSVSPFPTFFFLLNNSITFAEDIINSPIWPPPMT